MTDGGQLILDLAGPPAMGRDDFHVTATNAEAVSFIDAWPDWPARAAILTGPSGSGKSHLADTWRQRSGAVRVGSDDAMLNAAAPFAALVEDLPGTLSDTRLFHLLNAAREFDGYVLLTSRAVPARWGIALPDLVSRLAALPAVAIGKPDDELLRAVLAKQFVDRQIAVDEPLLSYMLTRMPRSMAAARSLVEEIDRRALENHAEVTRVLAAKILAGLTEPDLFET